MPNKKQGFRCSKPLPHSRTIVCVKSKQWTNEQMEAAMKSILDGRLSAIKAADLHGVTRTMLKDRLSGQVDYGTNPGPKIYLTADEEGKLCRHLCVSNMGLWKTQHDVTCLDEMHVKNKGLLRATQFPMVGGKNNGHDGKYAQYVNTKTHAHLHTRSHKTVTPTYYVHCHFITISKIILLLQAAAAEI